MDADFVLLLLVHTTLSILRRAVACAMTGRTVLNRYESIRAKTLPNRLPVHQRQCVLMVYTFVYYSGPRRIFYVLDARCLLRVLSLHVTRVVALFFILRIPLLNINDRVKTANKLFLVIKYSP